MYQSFQYACTGAVGGRPWCACVAAMDSGRYSYGDMPGAAQPPSKCLLRRDIRENVFPQPVHEYFFTSE